MVHAETVTSLPARGDALLSLNTALCPAEHEDDLERWKEEYADGKTGYFGGLKIHTNPDVFPAEKGSTSRDLAQAIQRLQHEHERLGEGGRGKGEGGERGRDKAKRGHRGARLAAWRVVASLAPGRRLRTAASACRTPRRPRPRRGS